MSTTVPQTHLQHQITIATERDLHAIIDLQECWRRDVGRLTRSAHADHIRHGDTLLITHRGQEAGYLMAHCGKDHNTNILQVAVHEDLLRSTLGTQLMQAVVTRALAHDQLTIKLRTRTDLPANQFWPSVGYYFAGEAVTRNRLRSRLNCWVRPLTAPIHVPAAIRDFRPETP